MRVTNFGLQMRVTPSPSLSTPWMGRLLHNNFYTLNQNFHLWEKIISLNYNNIFILWFQWDSFFSFFLLWSTRMIHFQRVFWLKALANGCSKGFKYYWYHQLTRLKLMIRHTRYVLLTSNCALATIFDIYLLYKVVQWFYLLYLIFFF